MKANEEHFSFFEKRIQYWQIYFGLTEWDIGVFFESADSGYFDEDEPANTITDLEAMIATVRMSDDWGDQIITPDLVDSYAFHELCEVMLAEVEELGDARYVRKGELRSAIHKVINRMDRTVRRQNGKLRTL